MWFHNDPNNWLVKWKNKGPVPLETFRGISVTLTDVTNGTYTVEWWDTYKGKVTNAVPAVARDGTLVISPPPFDKDVACKITRQ